MESMISSHCCFLVAAYAQIYNLNCAYALNLDGTG